MNSGSPKTWAGLENCRFYGSGPGSGLTCRPGLAACSGGTRPGWVKLCMASFGDGIPALKSFRWFMNKPLLVHMLTENERKLICKQSLISATRYFVQVI